MDKSEVRIKALEVRIKGLEEGIKDCGIQLRNANGLNMRYEADHAAMLNTLREHLGVFAKEAIASMPKSMPLIEQLTWLVTNMPLFLAATRKD